MFSSFYHGTLFLLFFNPFRGNDNHSNSREVSAFHTVGLEHLPPSPSIPWEFRLVRIHQPLRVGHRLILVFKIFKVEIGLGGGKDPLKSVGSIQLILRLSEEVDGDKVQGSQGWQWGDWSPLQGAAHRGVSALSTGQGCLFFVRSPYILNQNMKTNKNRRDLSL